MKRKWVEELDTMLWAYRTSPRTAAWETTSALVYGEDIIVPVEIIFDSPRVEAYGEQTNEGIRQYMKAG